MEERIRLDVLPKDADRLMEAVEAGHLAVARSQNDFLYILAGEGEYQVFAHTPGSPGGGRRAFPRDEKGTAIVKNMAAVADAMYTVEYDEGLDLYGVLASAEEGILSAFPGVDRDADGDVEFVIPKRGKDEDETGGTV